MIRKALNILIVNVLILLTGMVLLELLFGDWFVDNKLFLTRIPRDEIRTVDVSSLYKRNPSEITYTRDKYGLRGQRIDPGEIDILTVGGSTTEQRFIDDSETWQTELSQYLENQLGRRVAVVNAGVDGQTSFGHLLNFSHWFPYIPNFQPKYILFYVSINDIWAASPNGRFDEAVMPDENELPDQRINAILIKSVLFNAWINWKGYKRMRYRVGYHKVNYESTDWIEVELSQAPSIVRDSRLEHIDAYKTRLLELANNTRAMGAKPIFVNQIRFAVQIRDGKLRYAPSIDVHTALAQHYVERYFAEATMEACRQADALCIDLYSELGPYFVEKDFYDQTHNTPSGTAKIGKFLGKKLLGQL